MFGKNKTFKQFGNTFEPFVAVEGPGKCQRKYFLCSSIAYFVALSTSDPSLGCIYSKRPTAEECHEHRWLLPTEFMIKKRERAIFLGNRLKVDDMMRNNRGKFQAVSRLFIF